MTTLLSTFTPDSLSSRLDRNHIFLPKSTDQLLRLSKKAGGSLEDIRSIRQFSPVSQKSVASAPVACNNENLIPFTKLSYWPLNSLPKLDVRGRAQTPVDQQGKPEHRWPHFMRSNQILDHQGREIPVPPTLNRSQNLVQKSQRNKGLFQNDTPTIAKQKGCTSKTAGANVESFRENTATVVENAVEPFPCLDINVKVLDTTSAVTAPQQSKVLTSDLQDNSSTEHPLKNVRIDHRHRPSDASSAFIHSIKTASMSNVSFSIVPRSLRLWRSSESQPCVRGYSRHSLDSDRPVAGNLDDEAALRRGMKRKQIIEELIVTEEGYVADLKALAYLYTTLLVPATTSPDNLGLAVSRNITELLRNHETLLEKLRYTVFRAAARRWAETKIPTRLEPIHRFRIRNGSATPIYSPEKKHFRVRSSIDAAEFTQASHILNTAEPSDVQDIAEVFGSMMETFHAYEEYCANHQTVTVNLQKFLPETWSTYESGIESLSRSLASLDQRKHQGRRGLTISDLLIKPVQRICRYPLILNDLLKYTPIVDGPAAHNAVDTILDQFKGIAQTVNSATENQTTRSQMQRKWLLRDRMMLREKTVSQDQFRTLGTVQLCGVLYVTYQSPDSKIHGFYAACILFDHHLLIATPTTRPVKLEPFAVLALVDLQLEPKNLHKGLQAVSSLHTWKMTFTAEGNMYEILLSGCSSAERDIWLAGLLGEYRPETLLEITTLFDQSRVLKDLKVCQLRHHSFISQIQSPPKPTSISGSSPENTCKVMLCNTYNPQDLHEFRGAISPVAARSRSESGAQRIIVLAPKRIERTRLETALSDVYTRDRLPFPGMIGSTSSRIIRASAGSLVRKLSFASMQATFSRRSTSLSSKKTYHTIQTVPRDRPAFSVRVPKPEDQIPTRDDKKLSTMPLIETMDSVIGRMIGGSTVRKRLSFTGGEKIAGKNITEPKNRCVPVRLVGPDDPASMFYDVEDKIEVAGKDFGEMKKDMIEENMVTRKKRWSNPISKLRGLGSDGIRNILYSSS